MFICCVYIPPACSKIFKALEIDIWDEIEKGIELYSSRGKNFVTGDMNGRTSEFSDILSFDRYIENNDLFLDMSHVPPRKNKDKILDQHGRRLLDLCKSTNFVIADGRIGDDSFVGEYTFCSKNGMSTVDYVLIESTDLHSLSNFQILPLNEFSDHAALYFGFVSHKAQIPQISIPPDDSAQETKIFWDASKECLFQNRLLENHDTLLLIENSDMPINDKIIEFSNFLSEHSNYVFGKKYTARNNKATKANKHSPWFNEGCKVAQKEFASARNTFLKHKTDENRHNFVKYRTKYNRVKTKARKIYKINEGKKLSELSKRQPKKFWKKIKSFRKDNNNNNGNLKIEDLLQHFKSMFSDETIDTDNNETPDNRLNFDDDLDAAITLEELKKAVFHQKNKSACGLDTVCTEAIKASFDIVSSFLLKLVNQIFDSGEYPESWGLGIITPIFKSGDRNQAKNYRGITVSNILSKIYSQILLNRLTKWSEKHEFLCKNQFGFQKGKSTSDCIYILHSIITKVLQSQEKLYCIFIDFEKAFDKIDRLKLWNKLITENVSSKMVLALKAMYKTVKTCIRHNNSYSAFIESKLGVKQGDPSSPMIFMMFINDLNENINNNLNGIFTIDGIKIFLLLYADDQVIFGKSPEVVRDPRSKFLVNPTRSWP